MATQRVAITVLVAAFAYGCGGATTTRTVDTPVGKSVVLGAPQREVYRAEVSPEHDVWRVVVYRSASCPRIPVDLVFRKEQTLRGDSVVSERDLGRAQVAHAAQGSVACDQGYAQGVSVALAVGDAVYELGQTDAQGYLGVNLSAELREKLYGKDVPERGALLVSPSTGTGRVNAGDVALGQVREHEQAVNAQLAELEAILARGTALSPAEIQRSYALYEQLRALAWHDPRFKAAAARFWELVHGRKQVEASEALGRNLKALESARGLLQSAGAAAIPIFVQAAANSSQVDARAVEWSQWELMQGLRRVPAACTSFSWASLPSYGLPPTSLFAAHYLHFAYGDPYSSSVARLCSFAR
jgi:hypothetical protein